MTKKLILLRHAKSYWGENGRFQFKGDDHDSPLNERGKKTNKLMSKYFLDKNISVDFIFSSTAKRATETLLPFKNKLISYFGYETHKKLYTFNYHDLLITKISAISIRPAFINCISSPDSGTRVKRTVSTSLTTSISTANPPLTLL